MQEICFYFYAAKRTAIFRGLPASAVESCNRALQIFSDICSSIHSGDITAEVLRKILQNADAFDKIAQLSQSSPQNFLLSIIHSLLQQYKEQLQSFEVQKKQLDALCSMLPDEVQGMISAISVRSFILSV